jgi:ribosomal subunit interface protein
VRTREGDDEGTRDESIDSSSTVTIGTMTTAMMARARVIRASASGGRARKNTNSSVTRLGRRARVRVAAGGGGDVKMLVQGLHLEITPAIDEYCRAKLGKACSHIDPREIREVNVRCSARGGEDSRGGHEHKTEVTVLMTRGTTLHADEAAENLYATIDSCADIVARAIRKHKEKHSGKGARHASHGGAKEAIIGADDSDDGDDVPPAA